LRGKECNHYLVYLSKLPKEDKMSFTLVRSDETHFEPVKFGELEVSIQASRFHYCSPRVDLPSSDDYDSFEVALLWKSLFCHPGEVMDGLQEKSWAKYWDNDSVAGRVPREEVEKMLMDLGELNFT
jgi:hypothetical protein